MMWPKGPSRWLAAWPGRFFGPGPWGGAFGPLHKRRCGITFTSQKVVHCSVAFTQCKSDVALRCQGQHHVMSTSHSIINITFVMRCGISVGPKEMCRWGRLPCVDECTEHPEKVKSRSAPRMLDCSEAACSTYGQEATSGDFGGRAP